MKYKFVKVDLSYGTIPKDKITYFFGVEVLDKKIEALELISWHGWTPQEIQMIIDNSKALKGNERYKYQVPGSDFLMWIYPNEVFFFDMHHDREDEDFKWTFTEFIDFMEKFKKFVKDNK